MDMRAGYKSSELGVIPSDWDVSTVGQEFDVKLGKMLDAEKNSGVPKPYVGNRAIQWNRIDISGLPTVLMSSLDVERYRLEKGDLLVCEGGEVGRAAIWDAPIDECYYQKALHRLRPLHGFDVHLMAAFLHHWSDRGVLANYVTQTSIAHLPREKFIEVPMPVPGPREQRAIAEALSDVDALLAGLDRVIAKKRDLKQAAMQQLLTGQTRLPGFSGEWVPKEMDALAAVDPENLSSDTSPNYTFNYISLEQVDAGRLLGVSREIFRTAPSRARRVLCRDDVLMSTVRPNLKAHLHYQSQVDNAVCSTGFAVLRARSGISSAGYLFAHLFGQPVNQQIEKILAGSNYPAINSGEVRKLEIPCPPSVDEQTAIATVLSDMDAELAALDARRAKTHDLKQAMMQELLTGKTRLVIPEVAHA